MIVKWAAAAAAATTLAGCASASSSHRAAHNAAAITGSAAKACRLLERWENSSATGNLEQDTSARTRIEVAGRGTQFGSDFSIWMSDIAHDSSTNQAAGLVTTDCSAAGVPEVINGGSPEPAPVASAAPPRQHTVTYIVTGTQGADVTYGPAGSDLQGTVPMRVVRRLGSPAFYAVSAQLQGGGQVVCAIKVDGKTISRSVAQGGYNIASCEISQDPLTGAWESDEG